MTDSRFVRNQKVRDVLSSKHLGVIGCGSGGSAVAVMGARAGFQKVTLVDGDTIEQENLARHVLVQDDVGTPKVVALKNLLLRINPEIQVRALQEKFQGLPECPDVIAGCVDSEPCSHEINEYSLRHQIPVVHAGAWGSARVVEVIFTIPDKTPCYACVPRMGPQAPPDTRKYTDIEWQERTAGQEGLWCDILMGASLQFQVILGILGLRPELIRGDRNVLLLNIHDWNSDLQPLAVTYGKVPQGCAVCNEDYSRLKAM